MSPPGAETTGEPTAVSWTVPPAASGERLDRHAAAHLDLPRNRVQGWIASGELTVNGRPSRSSFSLQGGERLSCRIPPPRDDRVVPEPGLLHRIHEDDDLLLLDKPAGQIVHPGAGHHHGTLCNFLLHEYPALAGIGGVGRPGIVHRLDRDTSGILVVAKSDLAYRHLTSAFAERRVEKTYLAVVYGNLPDSGRFDEPIARHRSRRKEMAVDAGGRPSRTHFRTLDREPPASVAAIDLETGRTHQIRVHFKHGRFPLVGDPVYGENRWREVRGRRQKLLRQFPRPALHAFRLTFDHPRDGRPVSFEAPLPDDLRELWRDLAGRELPAPP
ncbi:MAG: RluA family pseudouridine synthase [Acidobacteriota bacterium]